MTARGQLTLIEGGASPHGAVPRRGLGEIVAEGRQMAPDALIPRARSTDPDTSQHAAASVGNGLEPLIVAALVQYGGQTKDEIARRIPQGYAPSITSAISRLRKAGMVRDSGVRRESDRGRPVIVWEVLP